MDIETISELVENQMAFECKGYSVVKLTIDGVETPKRVPIKSTGVTEFQEKLSQKAPRPPTIEQPGKDGQPGIRIFDHTDEKYIDDQEKHLQDFQWRLVAFAVDAKLTMANGETAKTIDEKLKVLNIQAQVGY